MGWGGVEGNGGCVVEANGFPAVFEVIDPGCGIGDGALDGFLNFERVAAALGERGGGDRSAVGEGP